ncbi:MAG: glycosyltransferase family 2 protein [Balneolaceae bacterium]|nr:MAG: glycosyltransferase family 2 protein [Balneolaceae bacterium]
MSAKEATVIVPTTGDRGALLPYSVGSIQKQTLQDIEIFIIGDGVTDETREIINKLEKEDSRITFFDHPKHERRGEPYRHQALQQAKGRMICYLCDRDLMLPYHLETMKGLLMDYNFASTTYIDVRADQSLNIDQYIGYYGPASETKQGQFKAGISLSNTGHTLELYHKLPYGWRTTPKDKFTDIYMWIQFHSHPECNAYSHTEPTIMYFKRGHFPGASVAEREKELAHWAPVITSQKNIEHIKDKAFRGLLTERHLFKVFKRQIRKTNIVIRGYRISEVHSKIFQKAARLLKKL